MKLLRVLETIEGCITKGRLYSEFREYTGNQGCVIIVDDNVDVSTLFKDRFKEVIIKKKLAMNL